MIAPGTAAAAKQTPAFVSIKVLPITILVVLAACTGASEHYLVDEHDVLSADSEERITMFQSTLLTQLDIELAIDIPNTSPTDLDRYAHDLVEKHRVGSATRAARGALLVVDVERALVRMEIGTDLEHVYPDAFVSHIEHDQFAYFFRDDRIGDGIEAAVELLFKRAQEGIAGARYNPDDVIRRQDFSAGGGARVAIRPAPNAAPAANSGRQIAPQATPADLLYAYMRVLEARNVNPNLLIYTPDTRAFLSSRTITPAQLENERAHLEAMLERVEFVTADSLAVALFDRSFTTPPYFLRRSREGWMLDLAASNRIVGFDLHNRWYQRTKSHEYAFAF